MATAQPLMLVPPQQRQGVRTPLLVLVTMALVVAGQALLDASRANIYCSVICAAATAAVILYCFRRSLIGRFPLSTFAVLGFSVTNYSLPLLAQTLDRKPLIFNLISPIPTFNATIAFQAVILAAHVTYTHSRGLTAASRWLSGRVLMPLWLFRYPRAAELWLLGSIGLAATWVSRILYVGDVDFGNVGGKFLQALVPFIVAPLFIPLRGLFLMRETKLSPITVPALIAYFAVVVATAIAFNARAIFAVVLFTVILATVLMMAMGRLTISPRRRVVLLLCGLVALPLISTAQNLATAMQIARLQRGTASTGQMVSDTIRAFNDPESLAAWRRNELSKTSEGGYSGYSEIYLDSEFLQRLTYTKYTDLTITASRELTDWQRSSIRSLARVQIISILPTPLIKLLGFQVDKSELQYSTGDIYADYAFGQEPGGERTGSSITNTMDVLDNLWAPIVYLIYIATFVLLESYVLRQGGRVIISTLAFILLYEIFARSLTYDSFRNLIDGITRAYVQALVVYTVLASGARIATGFVFGPGRPARALP